jgi:adenine-specific DNA-methyltransferase
MHRDWEADRIVSQEDNLSFLRAMPPSSVALTFTSPPYNLGKSYEGKPSALEDYLSWQEEVIGEVVRVTRDGGSICWQVGNYVDRRHGGIVPLDMALYPIFAKHRSLRIRNRIIWSYGHGMHLSNRFSGRHETIVWLTKGEDYAFDLDPVRIPQKYPWKMHHKGPKAGQLSCNPLGKNPGDVWEVVNVKSAHVEKTGHPCQFPVELAERLVLPLTKPGDVVLDPHMGAGSTLVAAAMHGRRAWGCDVVPEYVGIAQERLRALDEGTLKVRPLGKPILAPPKKPPKRFAGQGTREEARA